MIIDESCNTSFEYGEEENFYNIKFDYCKDKDYKKTFPVERIETSLDGYLILAEKNDNAQFYQTMITRFNNVISFKAEQFCEEMEIVLRKVKLETEDFIQSHAAAKQTVLHPQTVTYVDGSFFFKELPSFIIKINDNIKTMIINNTDKIFNLNFLYSIKIIL